VNEEIKNYVTQISLSINNVVASDLGTYICIAKNSLGESNGAIKLSGNKGTIIDSLIETLRKLFQRELPLVQNHLRSLIYPHCSLQHFKNIPGRWLAFSFPSLITIRLPFNFQTSSSITSSK
jgi:hypothetical protein